MRLSTKILIGVGIIWCIVIFLNSYNIHLNVYWSENPLMDASIASIRQIAIVIGAMFGISAGLRWNANRKKNEDERSSA